MRQDEEGYFEAVVVKDEIAKLNACLDKYLGPAIEPSQLPKELEETVKEIGGVRSGQGLHYKRGKEETIIALLWPWQDGMCTTIKIVK